MTLIRDSSVGDEDMDWAMVLSGAGNARFHGALVRDVALNCK